MVEIVVMVAAEAGGNDSRRFNRGSPAPKPVEVGKEYEVDITESADKEMVSLGYKDLYYLLRMERSVRMLRFKLSK